MTPLTMGYMEVFMDIMTIWTKGAYMYFVLCSYNIMLCLTQIEMVFLGFAIVFLFYFCMETFEIQINIFK